MPAGRSSSSVIRARAETSGGVTGWTVWEIHRFDQDPETPAARSGRIRKSTQKLHCDASRKIVQRLAHDQVHRRHASVQSAGDFLLLTALSLRRSGAATHLRPRRPPAPSCFSPSTGGVCSFPRALKGDQDDGFALADVMLATRMSRSVSVIERGGKSPEDVFVIRNGPDPALFRPPSRTKTRSGDGARLTVIGYVGIDGKPRTGSTSRSNR